MIKIIETTSTGVVSYACTEESDINRLPKKGIGIGSSARLINESGLRIFMFTQLDTNTEGKWVEV